MEKLLKKLDKFDFSVKQLKTFGINVSCEFKYGYILSPSKSGINISSNPKDIGLTLMGITHGNEVAGIDVLAQFVEFIGECPEYLTFPVALILGNYEACLQDKRFLDKDLNRSFDQTNSTLLEEKRARQIESILIRSRFLLDFHQTIEPTESPFFIFGYKNHEGFEFAREVDPSIPIVTHWAGSFSNDGRCSDEFVISNGGTGITLELGQNSFNPYHVAVGFRAALKAVKIVQRKIEGKNWSQHDDEAEIYTWGEVLPFPEKGCLDEGWHNFRSVEKGQKIGTCKDGDLKAGVSGKILFPKYLRNPNTAAPAEICRILKKISKSDLPT